MNLAQLTDDVLIQNTTRLAREEREILTTVLHHMKEVFRRRLFSSMGYESIYVFAVKHLRYSEDQAYRRVQAMHLLGELPEIETQIRNGDLLLSHISVANSLFNQEARMAHRTFSHSEKIEVLANFANKPIREAQKIAISLCSTKRVVKPDQIKLVADERLEFQFEGSIELQKKIQTLKGFLAHSNPQISLGELFEKLCDLGLDEWQPSKPLKRKLVQKTTFQNCETKAQTSAELAVSSKAKTATEKNPMNSDVHFGLATESVAAESFADESVNIESSAAMSRSEVAMHATSRPKTESHATSRAQIRREVFAKAGHRCQNCKSTYALEMDHIKPRAFDGGSGIENLRVLCRSCNQRAAIRNLGLQKMNSFLNT